MSHSTHHLPQPVLLTSFGAFPGVPDNVSDALVLELAKSWNFHQSARSPLPVTALLDVNWRTAAKTIRDLYARHTPAIALHFGVTADAAGLVIEQRAFNKTEPQPDAAGELPPGDSLCSAGPDMLSTHLDVVKLAEELAAKGHQISVSTDPGRYLCNAVYYEALSCEARDSGRMTTEATTSLFIHIPSHLKPNTTAFAKTLATSHDLLRLLSPSDPEQGGGL